ncbi:MAG: hypothetical protein KDB53_19510 [Planctomycetes bacterium]|nr:hypothetical protein [Planctomycetota bacterium]
MHCRRLLNTLGLMLALTSSVIAQSFLDFEFVPGSTPADGLTISTQFQATIGVSFILEDGTFPQLARVGSPRTAFSGFGGDDLVAPGVDVGQFFLTDDGVVSGAPSALLVNYVQPVYGASGVILDIDFSEAWTVEAKDAAGNVLATEVLGAMGNGSATPFSFDVGAPLIAQIRIAFTGSGSSIGLAFDNFLTTSPGFGSGQANSNEARLEVNRQGATMAGPFDVLVGAGSRLDLAWGGPPGKPVVLIAGPLNPGAANVPCFGSIDIGTPPFFPDLVIVFDGGVFPQSLFLSLDAGGRLLQSSFVPASASGAAIGLQGIVFQAAGAPCSTVFTAAFDLTIL